MATPEAIRESELKELREQDFSLFEIAKREVRNLYSQIAGTNFMVAFANRETVIWEAVGDDSFQHLARQGGILPGTRRDESLRGTNASANQLREGRSRIILDTYHRCQGNIVKTAHELAVSRNTVYRELRRQGVF